MDFQLDTLTSILVAVAPAVSAVLTIIAGIVSINKKAKNAIDTTKQLSDSKVNQTAKDIAIIKSKLASIEKNMKEK